MTRALLLVVLVAGCPKGRPATPGDDDGMHDAHGAGKDAAAVGDAPGVLADATGDAPVGGLDPDLSLPDPNGQVCHQPGAIGAPECPAIQVCRYYSPTEGRCETCGSCGNLNATCTATNQYDILFECYQHRCTNFCTLGSSECGAPADCIDIGYPLRGVCRP